MSFRSRGSQEGTETGDVIITPGWGGPPPDEMDEVVQRNLDLWMKERERGKTRIGRLTNATLRLVGLGSIGLAPGRLGGQFAALVRTIQTPDKQTPIHTDSDLPLHTNETL